jgi:hypothetical protein
MFSRVLVHLHGSPRAESALPSAGAIARLLDAEVSLVRVVRPPVGVRHSYSYSDAYREAENYLNRVARDVASGDRLAQSSAASMSDSPTSWSSRREATLAGCTESTAALRARSSRGAACQ